MMGHVFVTRKTLFCSSYHGQSSLNVRRDEFGAAPRLVTDWPQTEEGYPEMEHHCYATESTVTNEKGYIRLSPQSKEPLDLLGQSNLYVFMQKT